MDKLALYLREAKVTTLRVNLTIGLTLACVVAATALLREPPLLAQSVSAGSMAGSPPPPDQIFSNPQIPVECFGYASSYFWDDAIYLTLTLSVSGTTVDSDTFPGTGEVDGSLNQDIELDKQTKPLHCDASYWTMWGYSGSDSASGTLPARIITSLVNLQFYEEFIFTQPGQYSRYRKYAVKDDYNYEWNYPGTPVTEDYAFIGENSCPIESVGTADATLNNLGSFDDEYFMNVPGKCLISPDCRAELRQYVYVDSAAFDHEVTFDCYNVQVNR